MEGTRTIHTRQAQRCPIPQWHDKAISASQQGATDNQQDDEDWKADDRVRLSLPGHHCDDEIAILPMSNFSHLVFHENYETAAVFGAIMMPTRGTFDDLGDLETIDSNDSKQDDQELPRGRHQVWCEDHGKSDHFAALPQVSRAGMLSVDFTQERSGNQSLNGRD